MIFQYSKSFMYSIQNKHFLEYLKRKEHAKLDDLKRMEPQRLKMRWQTKNNSIDCGIYAMRHMETYFGGGSRTWDSKIQVESVCSFNLLIMFMCNVC